MPFFVDDSFHSHPKPTAASLAAIGLWTAAGSWSSNHLTDGFVPDHQISQLSRGQVELAKELVAAGLWRRTKGGYQFHEWEADAAGIARNPTRSEAIAKRSKMASGGQLGNHRRWHVDKGRIDPKCAFCQGEDDRPPNRPPDRVPESGSDSGASPINQSITTGIALDAGHAGSQSVRAHARTREAARWLTSEYGLTDDEAISVWAEAERRAKGEVIHAIPYLRRMVEKGHLAPIVEAVQLLSEPILYPVPDAAPPHNDQRPEPAHPTAPEPAGPPPMPREKAADMAHLNTCKILRCPRCAGIAERWPDLRRSGT